MTRVIQNLSFQLPFRKLRRNCQKVSVTAKYEMPILDRMNLSTYLSISQRQIIQEFIKVRKNEYKISFYTHLLCPPYGCLISWFLSLAHAVKNDHQPIYEDFFVVETI